MKRAVIERSVIIGCLALLPGLTAHAQSLQDEAMEVNKKLQARKIHDEVTDPPFIFGHILKPLPQVTEDGIGTQRSGTEEAKAPPVLPPSWKGNGTMTMRGGGMKVFIKGEGYAIDDTIDGYKIIDLNENVITVKKRDKTFEVDAR